MSAIGGSPPAAPFVSDVCRRSWNGRKGADELVLCHPQRGSKIDHEWFAGEFRAALAATGITGS